MQNMNNLGVFINPISKLLLQTNIVNEQSGTGITIHIDIDENGNLMLSLNMLNQLVCGGLNKIEVIWGLNILPRKIEELVNVQHTSVGEHLLNWTQVLMCIVLRSRCGDLFNFY